MSGYWEMFQQSRFLNIFFKIFLTLLVIGLFRFILGFLIIAGKQIIKRPFYI